MGAGEVEGAPSPTVMQSGKTDSWAAEMMDAPGSGKGVRWVRRVVT